MTDLISLIGIGLSAFVATNIDDIFLLMLFSSNTKFPMWQVVIGQYLGIGLLVAISALGSLLALIVPQYIIGLLGLIPISIGIIKLLQLRKDGKSDTWEQTGQKDSRSNQLSVITVAAVTFSNGGDNIGIYTPLFAKYNSIGEVITLVLTFLIMTAVWCFIG